MSLSVAKNAMHRAIEELSCRKLTNPEKDQIWKYFKSRCAYCDKRISRKLRHGHMDHLDCSANSGGNYIRNRVLACKECNGNEKREQNWQDFLRTKCVDNYTLRERKKRITAWQSKFALRPAILITPEAKLAREELLHAIQNFELAFTRFRHLIRNPTPHFNAQKHSPSD
jgi:hypothetical protein